MSTKKPVRNVPKKAAKPDVLIPVLICTSHRGVFYAEVSSRADLAKRTLTNLKNCRMAIRFGTDRGVMQLAHTGPTKDSRISAPADIEQLHDVTTVMSVTEAARAVWISR